jgi:hypothetical protein
VSEQEALNRADFQELYHSFNVDPGFHNGNPVIAYSNATGRQALLQITGRVLIENEDTGKIETKTYSDVNNSDIYLQNIGFAPVSFETSRWGTKAPKSQEAVQKTKSGRPPGRPKKNDKGELQAPPAPVFGMFTQRFRDTQLNKPLTCAPLLPEYTSLLDEYNKGFTALEQVYDARESIPVYGGKAKTKGKKGDKE